MNILEKWRSKLGDLHYFRLLTFMNECKKDRLMDKMLVISSRKKRLQRELLNDIMKLFHEDDFTNELYSEKSLTTKRFLIVQNPEKSPFVKKIICREDCFIKSIFYSSTFIPTVNIISLTNLQIFHDHKLHQLSYFIYL